MSKKYIAIVLCLVNLLVIFLTSIFAPRDINNHISLSIMIPLAIVSCINVSLCIWLMLKSVDEDN